MKYESKHGTVNFWDLYEDSLNRFNQLKEGDLIQAESKLAPELEYLTATELYLR